MNVLSRTTLTLATVALFTQTSPVLAQEAPGAFGCDYTDSSLYDGWGWNNTTQQSCEPLTNNTMVTAGDGMALQVVVLAQRNQPHLRLLHLQVVLSVTTRMATAGDGMVLQVVV